MNNNILALSITVGLFLGLLCASAASAENVGTIHIKFEKVRTKGNNSPEVICPVYTIPRNGNDNENGYCKDDANYESDLACLEREDESSTVTFKAIGRPVDYEIRGDDQSFTECDELDDKRETACTLPEPGNYKYSIVTVGQAENCMLDPRVIITDRGPGTGDEKE